MKYSGVHLSTQGSFYWIPTSIHVHFWALSWKDVFPNIKEFLVSFQGTSFIQVRECLSSPFSGYCTFCFSTHPTENRAPKRIGTTGRLPFIILLFIAFLSTTWRFVTTLHWASPSEPFSQQYLLMSVSHLGNFKDFLDYFTCYGDFLKDIFYVNHFENLYWICYNIASDLCFGFLVLKHGGFGPKAPWLRMEPPHPVLEEVLTAGLPGKSLSDLWFYY